MSFKLKGNWKALFELPSTLRREIPKAVEAEALDLRAKMRDGITSGAPAGRAFAPQAPLTGVFGGTGRPLIRTGSLVSSIEVFQTSSTSYFIGIRAPAQVKIGTIQEFGATVTQTWSPRQRAFFFAKLREAGVEARARRGGSGAAGATVVRIRIPARPFVGPIREKYGRDAMKRIVLRVAKAAGFGR